MSLLSLVPVHLSHAFIGKISYSVLLWELYASMLKVPISKTSIESSLWQNIGLLISHDLSVIGAVLFSLST